MKTSLELEKTEVQVGFIPILCAAPLILAHARGIFEKNGLQVSLSRAPGWGGIKELIAYGEIDAAHMLSPMPLACNLGIDGKQSDLKLAAIQNVNGQALTLASEHAGITNAQDMKGFTFGVPYRFSMHYYLLCHYLAQHGVNPLVDVTIKEVAPPNMPAYLEQGRVDGVFAPEPFNQIPVSLGTGFIFLLSKEIWDGHPCCSFATSRSFTENNPNTYNALLHSVLEAEWVLHSADPEERRAIARAIADPEHLNLEDSLPAEQVLSGEFPDGRGAEHRVHDRIDFMPHPFVDYGTWMLSQMQRWGQLGKVVDYREIVESTFDSSGAREIATALGYRPQERSKADSIGFDRDHPFEYMSTQPFCCFDENAQSKGSREIPQALHEHLAGLNARLAPAVGGRFDVEIEVGGSDELGRLEELLGELVLNSRFSRDLLSDRNDKLHRHKEQLEETVAARTAELSDANERMQVEMNERRAAQEEAALQSKVTDAINKVLREALDCETEEEVAQIALSAAEELTGSKFGFIGEINEEGLFDTIGLSSPGWHACEMEGTRAAILIKGMELRGIWATVLQSGASQIVNEPSAHPKRVGIPEGHPPLSRFLGVPFIKGGKAVGMIALANKATDYTKEDQESVEALVAVFYEAILRKRLERTVREHSLLKTAQAALAAQMQGEHSTELLCRNIITFLCNHLEVPLGIFYAAQENGTLRLAGSYAYKPREGARCEYRLGEGLVGQAALEQTDKVLVDVPESYFAIESGLGEMVPRCIHIKPILREDRVSAVLELGLLQELQPTQSAFLDAVAESISLAVEGSLARERQAALLEETQRQSEELQSQQEELRVSNEELEEQTQRLKASEERLRVQQEELQVTNEELEEKNDLLERQKRDVERARQEIAEKAEDLALASKYKSEFLANMSHELRTPLNSLLLLARSLADNREGNLDEGQIESARVIYQGGNDLLELINEILDLSKIEAGRMDLRLTDAPVADLAAAVESGFRGLAEESGLSFAVSVRDGTPEHIRTDQQRLLQVLKNIVGNAIKFTDEGKVEVGFAATDSGRQIEIFVADTGIGIAREQQRVVFEAFQQADGGTARKHGGTGLGLSISRELTSLLGGEIRLVSEPGEGSTFTVTLPIAGPASAPRHTPETGRATPRPTPRAPVRPAAISDDREQTDRGDRSVLFIEDDVGFLTALAKHGREQGFKILAATTGEEGVELAGRYLPRGIVLDLKLPGIDGWRVLDMLKENPATRHIPVHLMSANEPSPKALSKGAVGYVQKPVSRDQIVAALQKMEETASRRDKRVLLVEDDNDIRKGIVELIGDEHVAVDEATGGGEAIEALRATRYDCMILDLGLWDFDGDELLKKINEDDEITPPPVIVYTARDLTWDENVNLRAYSDSIIIKDVRSDERLLDEVTLFLHRMVSEMPEKKRQVITNLHDTDALLRDKTALVVDDDMRALFALTKILSERGMEVLKAENGRVALDLLQKRPDIDVVLMDIMMPELDGYETTRRIRGQERFENLPIIALTAKAMKDDRDACIAAGADDYLPKPVDRDRLISMLRVWLYR